eukprot:TRINITY_DN1280_c0_g1_i4.p1 TRINITY_DN1280_c0_g1~~TRINITY_DN1280_c0_g1_i4.p1  ORF type:complete len:271 (+),score=73.52 TRINITY_DN1280_c0_g1_i4:208-1020(+)
MHACCLLPAVHHHTGDMALCVPGSKDVIKCITLDISGTVMKLAHEVAAAYCGGARWVAKGRWEVPSEDTMRKAFPRGMRDTMKEFPCFGHQAGLDSKQWWRVAVANSFRHCGTSFPTEGDFEKVFTRIYQHYAAADAYHVFDDVVPLLDWADSQGLILGVITNNTERIVLDTLPMLGLHRRFDFFVSSHALGHEKPSREIFAAAAAMGNVEPGSILHIGDTYEADYKGARAAGFKALFLSRGGEAPKEAEAMPHTINSLSRVREVLCSRA